MEYQHRQSVHQSHIVSENEKSRRLEGQFCAPCADRLTWVDQLYCIIERNDERKSDEYADAAAKEASRDGKAASGEGLAEGGNGGATDCQVRASHGGTEVTRGRWRAQKGPTAQQVARN